VPAAASMRRSASPGESVRGSFGRRLGSSSSAADCPSALRAAAGAGRKRESRRHGVQAWPAPGLRPAARRGSARDPRSWPLRAAAEEGRELCQVAAVRLTVRGARRVASSARNPSTTGSRTGVFMAVSFCSLGLCSCAEVGTRSAHRRAA
jgi:hypothetical protein